MSDPIIENMKKTVKDYENDREKMEKYISILKKTGNNTAEIEARVAETDRQISKLKRALEDEGMM